MLLTNQQALLSAAGNVRPTNCCRSRAQSARPLRVPQPTPGLQPPPVRLRLEEAIENARKGREVKVFASQTTVNYKSWRKRFYVEEDNGILPSKSNQMLDIMRPMTASSVPSSPRRPKLRGKEGHENLERNRGTLLLRNESPSSFQQVYQDDIRIRCRNEQAMENMRLDREARNVLATATTPTLKLSPEADWRPRLTGEAKENYLKGRGLSAGGMRELLNHGWSERYGQPQRPSTVVDVRRAKSRTAFPDEMENGSEMNLIFGWSATPDKKTPEVTSQSPRSTRSVLREAQPNAAREGVAMTKLMSGGVRRNVDDSKDYRTNPRAKFEGIEIAERGRGTLTTEDYFSGTPEPVIRARIRPEAQEIADSHNGTRTKMLMTKMDELQLDAPPRRKVNPRSRRIVRQSKGGDAKECLNPTRLKRGSFRRRR